LPIETPAMENLSTLMGKYGEEGDKLLFKILNSGDYLKDVNKETLMAADSNKVQSFISEKGLRYDLTVPFARFVVQHRNEIAFPFKRYQIQPVWRADRPQKGRYREFYQCDVDVIGSDSLMNETELLKIIEDIYTRLGINVLIKLNNRKILAGIAEIIGESDRLVDITVAIDKLDKIGLESVNQELEERGLTREAIAKLQPILHLGGDNRQKLLSLKEILAASQVGLKGIDEIETVLNLAEASGLNIKLELDLTLARGLNYYTGAIIEVKSIDTQMGSICGGGRYDDLTGIFGLPGVSGVGVSFGAERIYDVLTELNLFPADTLTGTQVLLVNFGEKESLYCLKLIHEIRKAGISAELYPEMAKMKKQMSYADDKQIPYVILVGEDEMQTGLLTLKKMQSGEQFKLAIEDCIKKIKEIKE
ncbi:MAG: histidine--tRNA ligase, partial [Bacteroidota bacterium]|nr:histidine--tRNA ligase [Bacteroidota bacterium]